MDYGIKKSLVFSTLRLLNMQVNWQRVVRTASRDLK